MPAYRGTTKGFKRSGALLGAQIRKASESRGFAVSRVVTHWPEIAGEEIAAICRPVKVSYARQGFGATLVVLTTGAQAPMLEMQKEKLRERVNTAYGYNAIARVQITQTAPTGFAEGQASFEHRPKAAEKPAPSEMTMAVAARLAQPVGDAMLRDALEMLGRNVLSKSNTQKS
ncbi:Zn-ribbon-containing protein [Roseovarius atlanticus]|uniref:Zn-ribbon-containing protein n=1 Tax=Roseovarius atlanticus TaxID=1641875 RepID=A0A0T5NWH6_9RHOB|nr:DUF721 domain-containing protein [Roseovarius atlanticus]KRS13289.1 Zn-ribbon-containing protein [Roseovarius atlanticus]